MTENQIPEEIWRLLHEHAVAAMKTAYAPYSNFPVGAAALVDDGRIVTGCNVENASYGVGLCAECGLVSDLARSGGGRLVAFKCVDGLEEAASPCGRCRQLLFEFGGNSLWVEMPEGRMTMDRVLPGGFGPSDLERVYVADAVEDLEYEEQN
ncbi:cytidine deaminase [Actinomyces minihominis]|uniref:cytidine deaminase n=1 Tax=Actinomyces minihominis TaxID=2002838 RepID=UPI000C076DF1|nr:cytidine deaminase [Actinomyces minihominis]